MMALIQLLAVIEITLPEWAVTDDCKAWLYGLGAGIGVRLFRAALRWFKRSGEVDNS